MFKCINIICTAASKANTFHLFNYPPFVAFTVLWKLFIIDNEHFDALSITQQMMIIICHLDSLSDLDSWSKCFSDIVNTFIMNEGACINVHLVKTVKTSCVFFQQLVHAASPAQAQSSSLIHLVQRSGLMTRACSVETTEPKILHKMMWVVKYVFFSEGSS